MQPGREIAINTIETGPVCPLCRGPVRQVSSVASYGLQRCSQCWIEFLCPQPDDARLADIYSSSYFLHDGMKDAEERMAKMKSATGAIYLDALQGFVPARGARLLEIGCGHGDLLLEACLRGFEVAGVEFSPQAAAIANERIGRPVVVAGDIETAGLPAQQFDAAIFADVIEHVRAPRRFLERVHHVLKPSGVIMLVTPSLNSMSRRILGTRWMEYKPEHLFYFSPQSIRALLESCGFQIIRIGGNRKVLTLDYVWRHFARFKVPGVSPAIGLLRRLAPAALAYRHMLVPASGLVALAKKQNSHSDLTDDARRLQMT